MDRGVTFVPGEVYHVYNRGVEKRNIFQNTRDWKRFQELLYISNTPKPLVTRLLQADIFQLERPDTLVDILGYSQMTNHFHLIILEKNEGGISKFMSKMATAYSMYFNIKYERSGPLFCKPFRAKHVNSDDYCRWLFTYVHLNPLDIYDKTWEKSLRVNDVSRAQDFLRDYQFSSYCDYFAVERPESRILNKNALPIETEGLESAPEMLKEFRSWMPGL